MAANWEGFVREMFEGDRGDWDGGEIQEVAVKHGVLQEVTVTEPCDPEHCVCAEYGAFPLTCYRLPASDAPSGDACETCEAPRAVWLRCVRPDCGALKVAPDAPPPFVCKCGHDQSTCVALLCEHDAPTPAGEREGEWWVSEEAGRERNAVLDELAKVSRLFNALPFETRYAVACAAHRLVVAARPAEAREVWAKMTDAEESEIVHAMMCADFCHRHCDMTDSERGNATDCLECTRLAFRAALPSMLAALRSRATGGREAFAWVLWDDAEPNWPAMTKLHTSEDEADAMLRSLRVAYPDMTQRWRVVAVLRADAETREGEAKC